MALIGTYELLPIDTQTFFPVPVLLAVGEPILTEGRTTRDVDALTAELRERITALYAPHQPGSALYDGSSMTNTSSRPRIAIPVPTSGDAAYNDRCWPAYAAAVEAAGGEPVRIELGLEPSETARLMSTCEGVVLPGSPADVDPQKYGEAARPETAAPDRAREATDELLLQDAFNLRKPLLGVCFGLQMMNVWRGGTLVQHLSTGQEHAPVKGRGSDHAWARIRPGGTGASGIFRRG